MNEVFLLDQNEKQIIVKKLKDQIRFTNKKFSKGDPVFEHERDYLVGMMMMLSSIGVSVVLDVVDENVPVVVKKASILFPKDTAYMTIYQYDDDIELTFEK